MSSDFGVALIGLGGAAIGALAAFGGTWWQTSYESRRTRRDTLSTFASELVEVRWKLDSLARRIEKRANGTAKEHQDELRADIESTREALMMTGGRLALIGTERITEAADRLVSADRDNLARATVRFASVVRGEASHSWRERRIHRSQSIDEIFADIGADELFAAGDASGGTLDVQNKEP
jgi:hypothetical protein